MMRLSLFARSSCKRAVNYQAPMKRYMSDTPPTKSKFRGPVTFGSLAIVGIALVYGWFAFYVEKEDKIDEMTKKVKHIGKPALGGPWVLVDHNGIPRTDSSFHGKYCIYYFGFTHCPDICPSELVKVAKIVKALGKFCTDTPITINHFSPEKRGITNIQPLFISVDPSRDTVGQLRHYAQDFHKDIVYLTGTKDQVAKAARAYRVYFSKVSSFKHL